MRVKDFTRSQNTKQVYCFALYLYVEMVWNKNFQHSARFWFTVSKVFAIQPCLVMYDTKYRSIAAKTMAIDTKNTLLLQMLA